MNTLKNNPKFIRTIGRQKENIQELTSDLLKISTETYPEIIIYEHVTL